MPSLNFISQSSFDEDVVENAECFDLCEDEAVKETVNQYEKMHSKNSLYLQHLSLTHPESESGIIIRQERAEFMEKLSILDSFVDESGSIVVVGVDQQRTIISILEEITKNCSQNASLAFTLVSLYQTEAFYTLLSFYMNAKNDDDSSLDETVLQTLIITVLSPLKNTTLSTIQQSFRDSMDDRCFQKWADLWQHHLKGADNKTTLSLLLQLATNATLQHEPNKVAFVNIVLKQRNLIDSLLGTLDEGDSSDDSNMMTIQHTARLICSLCKFDDFRPSNSPLNVSSAHAHVLLLSQHGAVVKLMGVLKQKEEGEGGNDHDNDLLVSILQALRVLAIQDDIVQSMVAAGVLKIAKDILDDSKSSNNSLALTTACIALLRNLAANDDIKTTLCVNNNLCVLPAVKTAIIKYMNDSPSLCEHVNALLAAMALRKPKNAELIVLEYELHREVVLSMKKYPTVTSLQRQGALCIRNLASRCSSNSAVREALKNEAEQTLREIAGKHQESVDEAYAALRDLQCDVTLLKISVDGSTSNSRETFGDSSNTAANFRPVFETSQELSKMGI